MLLSGRLDSQAQLDRQEFIWQQISQAQTEECEIPTDKGVSTLSSHSLLTFIQNTPLIDLSVFDISRRLI